MKLFSLFRKSKTPEKVSLLWQNYLQFFEKKVSKKALIRELRFVVVDTETTGLNYKKDQLLSIAALSIQGFQIDINERYEAFFSHENYQPNDSVKIHGILNKHLKEGRSEKEILTHFLAYLKDGIIVGHHIGFDVAIINQALKKHFDIKLKNQTLDTAWLAERVRNPIAKDFRSIPLDKLCKQYKIPLGKRHTASGDAFITALLFLKLLGRLEKRKVLEWRDLF
ncbi:MAG: exonuclease domain-containing protein [Bacteroidetes bacterium]|jgi:DNA polymerase-3 subunit epsilon|nr:exonuclease domain-containing protein [Bacteroidota bacterium]